MENPAPQNLDMPVEEFLSGATAYDIPDKAMRRILFLRGIRPGEMAGSLGQRQLELATADVYMWCASTPSSKESTEDSDGGWKHKEGGWQTSAYDKRQLREMAKDLYAKWGETVAAASSIRIVNF